MKGRSTRAARPRWRRWARRFVLAALAAVAAWLALVIHPQPLFAHTVQRGNVVLHARVPLEARGAALAGEVVRRVSRSPLYDPARTHHVFLCDTPALFGFFEPWHRKVGGIAQVHLGGNVFIRPFDLERGTVIGPSGQEKTGERTLAYFVSHEVTHAMTADHVGRRRYFALAAFQVEGYADYVGFGPDHHLDFAAAREALRRGDREMSPKASGLYRRYELLVAHLLDRRGLSTDELLSAPRDPAAVEREVLAAP